MIKVSGIIRVYLNIMAWRKKCSFKHIIFFFLTKIYFQATCFKTIIHRIAKSALDMCGKRFQIYAINLRKLINLFSPFKFV